MMRKRWVVAMSVLILSACGQREGLAPVVESRFRDVNSHAKQHQVAPGETLYSIAFRYDKDYRQLEAVNHLRSPYTLRVGQMVRLQTTPSYRPVVAFVPDRRHPAVKRTPAITHQTFFPPTRSTISAHAWSWPIHGPVMTHYAPQQGKKGIDISGKKGSSLMLEMVFLDMGI
jgi:lipoprotein NlpD